MKYNSTSFCITIVICMCVANVVSGKISVLKAIMILSMIYNKILNAMGIGSSNLDIENVEKLRKKIADEQLKQDVCLAEVPVEETNCFRKMGMMSRIFFVLC